MEMTKQDIINCIEEFKGECFNDYENFKEYVAQAGWEKDYFSAWLDSCTDFPSLWEIESFCKQTSAIVEAYVEMQDNSNC